MSDTRTDQRQQTRPMADMRDSEMPQGQAPAERRTPPPTAMQSAAQERQRRRDYVLAAVRDSRTDFEALLKPLGVDFDFFLAGLAIGLNKAMKADDKFFDASADSIIESAMHVARLGLIADGKEAAIVRYATAAQALPMVQGFVKVLNATGQIVDINHDVIIEGDHFDFRQGDEGFIDHRPKLNRDIDGTIIGAWCIVRTKGGGRYAEVVDAKSLAKIAAVSKSTKGPRSVWNAEMSRKAPFRRLTKRLPQDPRLAALIDTEDANYALRLAGATASTVAPVRKVSVTQLFDRRQEAPQPEKEDVQDDDEAPDAERDERGDEEPEPQAAEAGRQDGGQDADTGGDEADSGDDGGDAQADLTEPEPVDEPGAVAAVLRLISTSEKRAEVELAWTEEVTGAAGRRFSQEQRDRFKEACVERIAAIGAPARQSEQDSGAPLVLKLVPKPGSPPKTYDDARIWSGGIFSKFSSSAGDALTTYWDRNLPFIKEALDMGEEAKHQAELVIAQAKKLGLSV